MPQHLTAADGALLATIDRGVAAVTLNRPAALNALSLAMFQGLDRWLTDWRNAPAVQVIVFRGAGGKAFCAGGDVRQVREAHLAGEAVWQTYFVHEYAFDHALHVYPKPIVSVFDGITMGGGMGIGQGSALRIATPRSRVAMPETAIGLFPDVGATWFLNRAPGEIGLYLGLTGVTLGAADALYAGLADVHFDDAALQSLEQLLLASAAAGNPGATLREAANRAATPAAGGELKPLRAAIDRHFGLASVEAIVDSLARETDPACADWAARTRELLLRRSPLSLKVTFRQLREGRDLTLADAFRRELGMVRAAFEIGDVAEGVRAVLIDKDHQPRWQAATLADVRDETADAFFQRWWPPESHPLRHL